MTALDMTVDVEIEDFTDELSDEALDRAEGAKGVLHTRCISAGPEGPR